MNEVPKGWKVRSLERAADHGSYHLLEPEFPLVIYRARGETEGRALEPRDDEKLYSGSTCKTFASLDVALAAIERHERLAAEQSVAEAS